MPGINGGPNQQPANWRYSIAQGGISLASYPGNVQFDGFIFDDVSIFATRDAVQSAQIPAIVNSISTAGYTIAGDGGGAQYIRAGGPSPGSIQSADGQHWAIRLGDYPNVKQFGARGDGVTNDLAAIQAAVDALPNGQYLAFLVGNYRVSGEIVLKRTVYFCAPLGGVQISQALQNSNTIRLGDGTLATRNQLLNITIDGLTFAPVEGLAVCTSGACIRVQYGAFLNIKNCDFFGADSIANKLWNAVELDRCEDSRITDNRFRRFRNNGSFTYGAAGVANRSVDIVFQRNRYSDIDGDHMLCGPHSQGIFINDQISIAVAASRSAIRINADPITEQGTNFFIVNPNLEGGNAANSNGIYVEKGQAVDIVGGWTGGFVPNSARAIWFGAGASSCQAQSVRVEGGGGVQIDGPACSVKDCEISGNLGTTPTLVFIGASAQGFLISGGRIRIATTSGIAITGTPADGVISGITFANIGGDDYITGAAYTNGPAVSGLRGQASRTPAAATSIAVKYGVPAYNITGATPIATLSLQAPGSVLYIQAGAGGLTFNNTGNIVLKGAAASITVAAFSARGFYCDGSNWFEV